AAAPPTERANSGRPCSAGSWVLDCCRPCTPDSAARSRILQVEEHVGQLVARQRHLRPVAIGQGRADSLHQPLQFRLVLRAHTIQQALPFSEKRPPLPRLALPLARPRHQFRHLARASLLAPWLLTSFTFFVLEVLLRRLPQPFESFPSGIAFLPLERGQGVL